MTKPTAYCCGACEQFLKFVLLTLHLLQCKHLHTHTLGHYVSHGYVTDSSHTPPLPPPNMLASERPESAMRHCRISMTLDDQSEELEALSSMNTSAPWKQPPWVRHAAPPQLVACMNQVCTSHYTSGLCDRLLGITRIQPIGNSVAFVPQARMQLQLTVGAPRQLPFVPSPKCLQPCSMIQHRYTSQTHPAHQRKLC